MMTPTELIALNPAHQRWEEEPEVSGPALKLASAVRTSLTVVIPAYNEGTAIGRVVSGVREALGEVEVVVVDDGSSDATALEAEYAGATVVRKPVNGGNGSAIKAGIRAASGDFILFMDGDGQHGADDIRALLAHVPDFDMVVGARDSGTQASLARRIANAVYNRLASWMTGHNIEDLTSGFRVVRRSVAREFAHLLPNGFSYPTTITISALRAGYAVKYVPFKARRRTGKSHIKLLSDGAKFFIIIFKIITLFSPIKVFLPLVGAAFLATLGCILASLVGAQVWTPAAVFFSGGLSLLGLGLVSEQICAMRFERVNLAVESQAARDIVGALS